MDFVAAIYQGEDGIAVRTTLKLSGLVSLEQKGKKFCPDSKGIPEKVIEDAFIESYKLLCGDNREVLDEFIERVEVTLSESNIEKSIEKIDKEITSIESKRKKLLDMCLEDKIDQLTYEAKMEELSEKSKKLLVERQDYVAKAG